MPCWGLPTRAGGLDLLPKGSIDEFRDAAARSTTLIVARVREGLLGHEGVHGLGEAQHGGGEEQAQELQDLHPPGGGKWLLPGWTAKRKNGSCSSAMSSTTTALLMQEAGKEWGTLPCLPLDLCSPSHPTLTDAASWECSREVITYPHLFLAAHQWE